MAQAQQMGQLLTVAAGADMNARQQAQSVLETAETTQTVEYINALVALMKNPQVEEGLRNLAGLQIKNALTGTSSKIAADKKQRWLGLDPNMRVQVKGALLRLLCDRSAQVARSAAIVIAKMGEIELSVKQWPELCSQLHDNVTNSTTQAGGDLQLAAQTRKCTLNAMGYLCEYLYDANCDLEPDQMNKLLTAIIFCMDDKQSPVIRHAAMQALSESLPFATTNFARANERNVIMKKVCEASQMQGTDEDSVKTRRFAYVCMTIVAQFYYGKCMVVWSAAFFLVHLDYLLFEEKFTTSRCFFFFSCFLVYTFSFNLINHLLFTNTEYLQDYVQVLFQLTVGAIKSDVEEVSHYAIEFWNTLCDTEVNIAYDVKQCENNGAQPEQQCKHFVRAAIKHLIPVVFEAMCKQSEDDEEGSLCVQAACCMQLCGQLVGDDILQFVMPLVMNNIQHQDWHLREAATYSFGAIMDGCSVNKVGQYANQSLPTLVKMVHEEVHDKTRGTTVKVVVATRI